MGRRWYTVSEKQLARQTGERWCCSQCCGNPPLAEAPSLALRRRRQTPPGAMQGYVVVGRSVPVRSAVRASRCRRIKRPSTFWLFYAFGTLRWVCVAVSISTQRRSARAMPPVCSCRVRVLRSRLSWLVGAAEQARRCDVRSER